MKEAYVDFDTAKLLKEKGFDWEVHSFYEKDKDMGYSCWSNNYNTHDDLYSVPTQQTACRWLREEHNILVTVLPCEVGAGVDDYTYVIHEIQPEDYHFKFIAQGRMQPVADTMGYEGTLEEGIKHVLTNLI
jgi:hypothetical protein